MPTGRYKHLLTIQAPALSEWGDPTGWTDLRQVWANVRPMSGREARENARMESSITHEVYVRGWFDDIQATHRVVFQGRTLSIESAPVNVDERGRETYFLAKEVR